MGESTPEDGKISVSNKLEGRVALAVLAIAVAVAGLGALVRSMTPDGYPVAQWNANMAVVIHSDNTQSVKLPDGQTLWVFGDTTSVNGKSVVSSSGYPHGSFLLQSAGSLSFEPVSGKYGANWQQVPNWPDGSYFWMSTPVVDKGSLYVLGSRVKGSNPYTVIGAYVAKFNAKTLQYENIQAIPDGGLGTAWGGAAVGNNGWWIAGTHAVTCSFETDCRAGDFAWVPDGQLGNPASWKIYPSVIGANENIGSVMALVRAKHGWDVYTKTGDAYGGTTIERLSSQQVASGWSHSGSYPAPSPLGTFTYSVAAHPEQQAPAGDVLVSYNVNAVASDYHARFEYLPK